MQGLLNKYPAKRLSWPQLLEHPFVAEAPEERKMREAKAAEAVRAAEESRAWRGELGAVIGAIVFVHVPLW